MFASVVVIGKCHNSSSSSSSSSSSRFIGRITQMPLMRYVSHCAANRQVINADMRLSMLSVGSRRNSGNEYPDDLTSDGERSTTKTCCDGVAAQSAYNDNQFTRMSNPTRTHKNNRVLARFVFFVHVGSTLLVVEFGSDSHLKGSTLVLIRGG